MPRDGEQSGTRDNNVRMIASFPKLSRSLYMRHANPMQAKTQQFPMPKSACIKCIDRIWMPKGM